MELTLEIAKAIPGFYDAAVVENEWAATLDKAVSAIGGVAGTIVATENQPDSNKHFNFARHSTMFSNLSSEIVRTIGQNVVTHEAEAWEYFSQQPPGVIHEDSEFYSDPDLDSREDYVFAIDKAHFRRKLAARLNGNRSWSDSWIVMFHRDTLKVSQKSRLAMLQLLPHAAKAIELNRTFSLLRSRYKAVLSALDHVSVGLCIVIANGEVIVSNIEAQRILESSDAIKLTRSNLLQCQKPKDNANLKQAVDEVTRSADGQGKVAERLLTLERSTSHHPLLLEVSPLRDSAAELNRGLTGALITLIDSENPKPFNTERIARAYGLTTAESAICKLLVDGWTNNNIADARNVSPGTVKSQVASVLAKTMTTRRSQLIRLALKASPPVKNPDNFTAE